ncbi:hypothetical protein [Agrobacterium larrymoorei]|uniref:hypothetical protein n=1 Tax=Agrobacterium larrymoorei TaxID=160699 RepID=UPI001F2A508A|nr:hypothetical protein [Agrobacterium larrymoorei]
MDEELQITKRIPLETKEAVMEQLTELRQQIAQDLETLSRTESPKSIFEIADDYLLGNPNLKRQVVEDIIKQEADKRSIDIH